MFTVLHQQPDGSKAFYKAARPKFGGGQLECLPDAKVPDAFVGTLSGGRIILMNERGHTVAIFDLEERKIIGGRGGAGSLGKTRIVTT